MNKRYEHLGDGQYFKEVQQKRQIYIHHTVSSNPLGTINNWRTNSDRIGAHIVIDKNGDCFVTMPINAWVYHLGLRAAHFSGIATPSTNEILNKQSIAIELVSWGGLHVVSNGEVGIYEFPICTNAYGKAIDIDKHATVYYEKPYRGFWSFEKYSEAQLATLGEVLQWLCLLFDIPKFKGDAQRIFDICPDALQGKAGIFSHSSVRPDKSDCHPQKELINLLNQL